MHSIAIAKELIRFNSVSRFSNQPISQWIANWLIQRGFEIEWLTYQDENKVLKVNLVAKRSPTATGATQLGGIAYLAHSDVVPAEDWNVPFCGPFDAAERDGRLWGRGSCDMKGSLACALAAIDTIQPSDQTAPIYLVCSADEELGTVGAWQIDRQSKFFDEMVHGDTVGIVGEPTLLEIVNAHKGGVGLTITSRGKSAHSSTRDGINANHRLIPILPLLLELQQQCEQDHRLHNTLFDPPTLSWNMILRNEPLAVNVTPSLAQVSIFLRTMPDVDHDPIVERVRIAAAEMNLEFHVFDKTPPLNVSERSEFVRAMLQLTATHRARSVCYATDGGVLRRLTQLVVCGPGSIDQAHRCDEYITLDQLHRGTELYSQAFRRWATKSF